MYRINHSSNMIYPDWLHTPDIGLRISSKTYNLVVVLQGQGDLNPRSLSDGEICSPITS